MYLSVISQRYIYISLNPLELSKIKTVARALEVELLIALLTCKIVKMTLLRIVSQNRHRFY